MKRLVGMCIACALLGACAGDGGGRAVVATEAIEPVEIAPGPLVPTPVAEAEPEVVAEPIVEADTSEDVKRTADDLLMRKDGRPSWWFGGTVVEGGRARVCAESLGGDMLGAKRGAIGVARERLRREMGVGPATVFDDERVERAWVWPLAHAETPGARYAGYVLVSVARE